MTFVIEPSAPTGGDHLVELGDRECWTHLPELPFETGLWFVLDDDPGTRHRLRVQLGLARTVAADRVGVHTRYDGLVEKDDR